jgi:hypothetical protein
VAKNHCRDRFPNADAFEVGCEAASESVPDLPFNPGLLEGLFHLATIQAIKIESFPRTVCKDRPRRRASACFAMLLEQGLELWDERNGSL